MFIIPSSFKFNKKQRKNRSLSEKNPQTNNAFASYFEIILKNNHNFVSPKIIRSFLITSNHLTYPFLVQSFPTSPILRHLIPFLPHLTPFSLTNPPLSHLTYLLYLTHLFSFTLPYPLYLISPPLPRLRLFHPLLPTTPYVTIICKYFHWLLPLIN